MSVSVRILGALGITLVVGGSAQASSLVFPGAPASTPSIIMLGAKLNDARSVVAVGETQPDVTYEKVSAIPDKPEVRHGFQQGPMVIRGGIVGSASSVPPPSAATAKAVAPLTGKAPATTTASAAPSGKSGAKAVPQPIPPVQPAAQPLPGVGKAK